MNMKDVYEEQLVARRPELKYAFYKGLLIFVVIFAALAGFFFHPALLFVAFLLGIGVYYLVQMFDIEYEYLYVNGELDFDKIYAKARRKRVLSVQMEHLEMMAEKDSHHLDSLRHSQYKTYDFSSGDETHKVYEMYIHTETELMQIFFEPNDNIIEAIRQISPRKVIVA